MTKYVLYWRMGFSAWNFGGTYATAELALRNAKKELSGLFEYRIESSDGGIAEHGTARGDKV